MRRGICGFYLIDLGLLSNFKSVRIDTLLETNKQKKYYPINLLIANKSKVFNVSKIRSGPFLVSRTGDEGFNLTLSR